MRKKIICTVIICSTIASLAANAVLFISGMNVYRQLKRVQIDPGNSLIHHHSNRTVHKKKAGTSRIVLFGDSRIHQWSPLPRLEGFELINRGVPGETTSQALLRIENDLLSLNPDMAIIQIGINDLAAMGPLPGLEEYIVENVKQNIASIIGIMERKKIRTVFLTVFPAGTAPPYRRPVWSEKTWQALSEINSFIRQSETENTRVVDCDEFFLEKNKLKKEYARDMLHLNEKGYMRLNGSIRRVIEQSGKTAR